MVAKIPIRVEHSYGHERKYVDDPKLAGLISTLTRRTCLTDEDIDALVKLGHQVGETKVLGRRLR